MTQGITIAFREEDYEQIKELAYQDRMNRAEYVRRAVNEYIEENTDEDGIKVEL